MSLLSKISYPLVIMLALIISLNSCKENATSPTSGQLLIDTSYLHSFKRITIILTGNYASIVGPADFHISQIENDTGTILTINESGKWMQNIFMIDTSITTTYNEIILYSKLSFIDGGIDSGEYYHYNHYHGSNKYQSWDDVQNQNLQFQNIVVISESKDSIIFSANGPLLNSHLSLWMTSKSHNADIRHDFKEIFWDKQPTPTLVVKLYR